MSETRVEPTEPERKSAGTRQWVPGERALWKDRVVYIVADQDEKCPGYCRIFTDGQIWNVPASELEPGQVCPQCHGTGWTKA